MDDAPPSNPPAAPPTLGGRRKKTCEWLRSLGAASLAELFEGAVVLLEQHTPGYIRFVAHAVREIANRLPAKVDKEHKRGRVEYVARLEEIRRAWGQDFVRSQTSPPTGGPGTTIPPSVVAKLCGLLDEHIEATARIENSIRDFFVSAERMRSGEDPNPDALQGSIRQWKTIKQWALDHTHEGDTVGVGVDESEFRRQFEVFEALLASFFEDFVDAKKGANEILENANS